MVNVQRVISCFPTLGGRYVARKNAFAFILFPVRRVLFSSPTAVRRSSSHSKPSHEVPRYDALTKHSVTPNGVLSGANSSPPVPKSLSGDLLQFGPPHSDVAHQRPFPDTQNELEAEQEEAYAATELELDDRQDHARRSVSKQLSLFLPSHVRGKRLDLSSVNSSAWEEGTIKESASVTASFRSSTPLRKLFLDYFHNIEPLYSDPSVSWHSTEVEGVLAQSLRSTLDDGSLEVLAAAGYEVTDLASWSWILSAHTVDLAAQRYTVFSEDLRSLQKRAIPKFILLQLLRSDYVSHFAFKGLVRTVLTDLRTLQEKKEYTGWGWVSRVCLVVRLLRHARQVAPDCFEDISLIIGHLFADYYNRGGPLGRPESRRLTHVFNRFLTLIALTPAKSPFNAYRQQQNAQLALVRRMVAFQPQLPITREGYRALITVQLLHRKTKDERTWAEVKSPSWPPWRQIKSGIEQDLEYPGKESRVMKLLGRMNEAGYAHGEWERSAAVLAGWDTDKSPTIQTRAILTRPPRPWTVSPGHMGTSDGPAIWAARIRATRSRREAWASFSAYEKSTDPSKIHYQPYFAMLEKLLVQTVATDSQIGASYTPGDVKEVFQDSTNPRDLIYIEKDVPSAEEFYRHMLRLGIRPGGSLLSGLLRSAPNIAAGFNYIEDSRWDDHTKRVLRHAEEYPPTVIRQTLSTVPDHTLAALIALLSRHSFDEQPVFRSRGEDPFGSDKKPKPKETVTPFVYAWELLTTARATNPRLWNALLEGCFACLTDTRTMARRKTMNLSTMRDVKYGMWWRLWMTFGASSRPWHIHPDLDTFRHAAGIVSAMLKDRRLHVSTARYGWFAKTIFLHAVYGRRITAFFPSSTVPLLVMPEPGDLRLLVRVLVSTHDVEGLVALVRWLNGLAAAFESLDNYPDPGNGELTPLSTSDLPPLRNVLCAIRLFLEGHSPRHVEGHGTTVFETPLAVHPETVQDVKSQCAVLGWPTDDEVELFLSHEADWLGRVARDADLVASRPSGRDHTEGNLTDGRLQDREKTSE